MRLNFEVSKQQMDSLKKLQGRAEAGSMKDLVNNALSMFEWAANEVAAGNEIAAINEEESTYRVLVMPALQNVARKERRQPVAAASI